MTSDSENIPSIKPPSASSSSTSSEGECVEELNEIEFFFSISTFFFWGFFPCRVFTNIVVLVQCGFLVF